MSLNDQARAAVKTAEVVGQHLYAPDRQESLEEWTNDRYKTWILSHYGDKIKDEDQIEKIYTTKTTIGQFAGDLHIVDDSNSGRAFIKTGMGPVTLTRGPVSWNPTDVGMLHRLCRYMMLQPPVSVKQRCNNSSRNLSDLL